MDTGIQTSAIISFSLGIILLVSLAACAVFILWGIIGYILGKKRNDQTLTNVSKRRLVKGLLGGFLVLILFVVINFIIQILGVGNNIIVDPVIPPLEATPTPLFIE